MQLYDKILGHLHLLQEMKKAGVSDTFVKDYKEEALFNLCRKVRELDAKDEISSMETEAVEYLVKDPGFLLYLVRLLREPVRVSKQEYNFSGFCHRWKTIWMKYWLYFLIGEV